MAWTSPKTYVAGAVHTAAELNTYERDNLIALQSGTLPLAQVKLDGASSDPLVSPAGDAVISYNTTEDQVRVSKNGGAFEALGSSMPLNDPVLVGYTRFGGRRL